MASNLKIEEYTTAVKNNGGYCVFENVIFDNDSVGYIFEEDYGGAVRNKGAAIFNNCTFINCEAKYGAAIYNEGALSVSNCYFNNNTAYSKGNDICALRGTNVTVDGHVITESNNLVKFINKPKSAYMTMFEGILLAVGIVVSVGVLCCVLTEILLVITALAPTTAVFIAMVVSLALVGSLVISSLVILDDSDDEDTGSDSDEFIHSYYHKDLVIGETSC